MSLRKEHVLLVDDEPLVLEMFRSYLQTQGYQVVCASNAQEALSLIERLYFDIAVFDVCLEGLSGFDLLTIARRRNESISCVLITGAPREEDRVRARTNLCAYLTKPVGLDLLGQTIGEQQEVMQQRVSTAS